MPKPITRLQKELTRPSHAYILVGELETGLIDHAKSFAKALQCENRDNGSIACGSCLSCRVFDSGNHPDIIYVKATKTKAIGVEDIRSQLVLPMSEKTFRYRYKIFIVDQPLTPQAQNALLKTIEEPAPFGIFLFLTEAEDMYLPTVLSRCVTIKLGQFETKADETLQKLAQSVASGINNTDILGVFALYNQIEKHKESIQPFLDMLYLYSPDSAIVEAKKALQQNGNFQMTVEMMLLKMSGVA